MRQLSHVPTCHWTSRQACLPPPCSAQANQVSRHPACFGTFSFLLVQRYLRRSAEWTVVRSVLTAPPIEVNLMKRKVTLEMAGIEYTIGDNFNTHLR